MLPRWCLEFLCCSLIFGKFVCPWTRLLDVGGIVVQIPEDSIDIYVLQKMWIGAVAHLTLFLEVKLR
jgi:hypothetical protein